MLKIPAHQNSRRVVDFMNSGKTEKNENRPKQNTRQQQNKKTKQNGCGVNKTKNRKFIVYT